MKTNNRSVFKSGDGQELSFESSLFGAMTVVKSTYHKGGVLAVELVKAGGEPFTVLSVNMPQYAHLLGEGEFFAKTWSENAMITEDALASGIFRDTGRTSGDTVNAPIWTFN